MKRWRSQWLLSASALVGAVAAASQCTEPGGSAGTTAAAITLTPVSVALPTICPMRDRDSLPVDTRYVFRREGNHDVLYFVEGASVPVVGDVPDVAVTIPNQTPGAGFSQFLVVASARDTTTYATYVRFRSMLISGIATDVSNVYALHGREMRRVLADLDPGFLQSVDRRTSLNAYVDGVATCSP